MTNPAATDQPRYGRLAGLTAFAAGLALGATVLSYLVYGEEIYLTRLATFVINCF